LQQTERTLVTPHEGNVSSSPNAFSPDDSHLYYTTDEGGEFQQLRRYDLATGAKDTVLATEWDVMFAYFSREDTYLVVGINAEASTELRMFDAASMAPVPLPDMPGINITSAYFSHGDSMLAFYASSSRSPGDLFLQDLANGGNPVPLTRSLNPNINPEHLVDAEVVYFASYDGVQIPGLLYKPHQASADNPAPALVLVHGGPGGQTRVGYSDLVQYLVNHGYVVYGINNRGSSGYGKTFYMMDDRAHGEADLGDVVASKQMLIDTGYIDADKVGIIGGSYGGYMTVAAMAFEPGVFNVGVDIFGVTNWVRTLQSIPPWWEAQRVALYTELGDPATDLERLERISPLFHAANIVDPMIVLQGANDPRVLQVESDELVQAIRDNDVVVEYIVFPDEGHGFRNRYNQMTGYRAILEFLNNYL
jgi:dipeptidyl aminopeptidase/acylaminoacyl peptidase